MTSNKPSKRLFVGSLPYRYTEGELLSLFIQYGKIIAVRIVKNRWGKSRGMGYVEFDDIDCAINAKNRLHNYFVEDRSIIVDFAQPDPFATPEGKQRHFEAQEKKPLERRKYLDEFGNRKPAVPRPLPESEPRRRFGGSPREEQVSQGGFSSRDDSRSFARSPESKGYSGRSYKGGKPVFNSLGRSLNKDKSEEYFPKFMPDVVQPRKKFRPAPGQKPEFKSSDPRHVRSSVFKQRKFGSKVGAKFAFKNKKGR